MKKTRLDSPVLYEYTEHDKMFEKVLYRKGATWGWLESKTPYGNVFNIVTKYLPMLKNLDYQVAYGYLSLSDQEYYRCCFLVREDKVLDVTPHFYEEIHDGKYLAFARIGLVSYLNYVSKYGGDLTLKKLLSEEEKIWVNYSRKNNIKVLD